MFRTALEKDRFAAAVIVRVTYDIKAGKAIPTNQQTWPLSVEPRETEYGPIESDLIYRKGGVDILILGKAIASEGKALKQMEVSVHLKNQIHNKMLVFGDRYWKKNLFGISISEPEPFTEIPLSLYNAFGGKAEWDELEIPYGNNPYGKGYYWKKNDAIGKPLPNIEDPNNLIQKWNDRPDPVGIVNCPMNGLRMTGNVEHENGKIKSINPKFYNTAFPKMIADKVKPGDQIEIHGLSKNGIYTFIIPEHHLLINLKLGDQLIERELEIDQICIFTEEYQAFITYRFPFRYVFSPMQKRECAILEKPLKNDKS